MSFEIGDHAKSFIATTTMGPTTNLGLLAGRYIILFFFGTASIGPINQFLQSLESQLGEHLDEKKFIFLGVTVDPDDLNTGRLKARSPGIHYLMDYDHQVSNLYQALVKDPAQLSSKVKYRQGIFILNPALRIIETIPFSTPETTMNHLVDKVEQINNQTSNILMSSHAPILVIPGVFENSLCQKLVNVFNQHGGKESGFMQERDGKSMIAKSSKYKIRKDYDLRSDLKNTDLIHEINYRIQTRIAPEIYKVHHFKVDYTERHIVCCYDSDTGGYFSPHRDNTTKATLHRKFAVTINLNSEEYEGGDLRFPEYGSATYRAPTGGAVVFSCSLLHEATPVINGKRYAFVPFLYDKESEKLRLENLKFVTKS